MNRTASRLLRSLALTAALGGCTTNESTVISLSKATLAPSDPSLIVAAGTHACARTADGNVVCWGDNEAGQLGNGSFGDVARPTVVAGLTGVKQLAASSLHTCALKEDGTVACFGANVYCELGTLGGEAITNYPGGDAASRPVAVPGVTDAVQIAVNVGGSCALRAGGTVQCWGRDGSIGGQGVEQRCETTLAEVPGLDHVVQIGANQGSDSCALRDDGAVWCWMRSVSVDTQGSADVLSRRAQFPGAIQIAVGASFGTSPPTVCALLGDGSVQCTGDNRFGQLGAGDAAPHDGIVTVTGVAGATRLFSSGDQRFCAVTGDGSLICWGAEYFSDANEQDTLGPDRCAPGAANTTVPCRTHAAPVEGLSNVIDAAVAGDFSCALSDDGSLRCFGVSAHGNFGDGATDQRLAGPTLVQF